MREIKFRGMDINGKWHIGLLCIEGKNYYISNSEGTPRAYKVRPETIGQYTGLEDKNGKEIYEGDLIKCKEGVNFYRICIYDENNGQYYLVNDKTDMPFPIGVVNTSHTESEIIGNIYENPNLINK